MVDSCRSLSRSVWLARTSWPLTFVAFRKATQTAQMARAKASESRQRLSVVVRPDEIGGPFPERLATVSATPRSHGLCLFDSQPEALTVPSFWSGGMGGEGNYNHSGRKSNPDLRCGTDSGRNAGVRAQCGEQVS